MTKKEQHAKYMREYRKKHPGASSQYTTAWARANRTKDRKSKKKWQDSHPASLRNRQLKHKYGITLEEYNALLLKQNGVCAVCKTPPLAGKVLNVDHDHKCCVGRNGKSCGKCVRGLIHQTCNLMLGGAKDSPTVLRLGAEYLESFRTEE